MDKSLLHMDVAVTAIVVSPRRLCNTACRLSDTKRPIVRHLLLSTSRMFAFGKLHTAKSGLKTKR